MARLLTSASKLVPSLITSSSTNSAFAVDSASSISRSYSMQARNEILAQRTFSSLPRQTNGNHSNKSFVYFDPVVVSKHSLSTQPKGFFGSLFDNIKEEFNKNKEIKDNIKKFRDQAKKLEDSDALKEARDKYKVLERETMKSSTVLREKIGEIGEKVKESDVLKKASDLGSELGKQAQKAAEKISETTGQITDNQAFKSVSQKISTLTSEIGDATKLTRPLGYRPPATLRKRSDTTEVKKEKIFVPDTETQTITLHKDSQWYQRWQNFKDNNAYLNKIFHLKSKYDESDNPFIRVTRSITEKLSEKFTSMLTQSESSESLTEICRIDPNFNIEQFVRLAQYDILPNILESLAQERLDILRDWCTEGMYNILTVPIIAAKTINQKYHLKIIDLSDVEFEGAKLLDETPIVFVRFQAQQISFVTDSTSRVVQGDPDKIARVNYVFALGRDSSILDPMSAWRLVDMAAHQTNLFV